MFVWYHKHMKLIIISGAEATGKSAIGKYIADKLRYAYHAKDIIKERMFDTENVSTWRYGWYEKRAKDAFFDEIKIYVDKGESLVLESNFIGEDKKRLLEILSSKAIDISEIHCYTKGIVSFRRFVRRNETKARHPGHHDRRWYIPVLINAIFSNLKIYDAHAPVKLSNKILCVDTTDFSSINNEEIIKSIESTD